MSRWEMRGVSGSDSKWPSSNDMHLRVSQETEWKGKTKTMKILIAVMLLAGIGLAQQAPDAPSETKRQIYLAPLRSPTFYLGVSIFASSAIYDVHSTKVCEANRTCVEAYRGHDTYRYITPLILMVGGATYGCELMLHGHRLRWYRRIACPALGIGLSYQHWQDGRQIYHESRFARP